MYYKDYYPPAKLRTLCSLLEVYKNNSDIDDKTREDHVDVNGAVVPIDEPFIVGGYEMMYPGDESLGAGPEEIINCRCSVEYLMTEDE